MAQKDESSYYVSSSHIKTRFDSSHGTKQHKKVEIHHGSYKKTTFTLKHMADCSKFSFFLHLVSLFGIAPAKIGVNYELLNTQKMWVKLYNNYPLFILILILINHENIINQNDSYLISHKLTFINALTAYSTCING